MFRSAFVRRCLDDPSRFHQLQAIEVEGRRGSELRLRALDLKHLRGARNEVIFLDQFYVF